MIELECLPYGVGHTGEGICLLVRMGPYRILLDCGLHDIAPLQSDLAESPPADLVLCSHAHADHARGLLPLSRAFPHLPIYASEVTCRLMSLNWPEVDPKTIPTVCQALPWRSPMEFKEGLVVQLFPAGHLPGASVVLLTYTPPAAPGEAEPRSYTLVYTGDFLLSNSRLVEGLPLEELRGSMPDVLILEGSYGTARHLHRRQQENQLMERISRAIAQGQSVLMPLPTLGIGQELLMLLRSHHYFTGKDLDIWVDGTVAAGCDVYLQLLAHFPQSVQNFAQHQPLFWDERVRPRMGRLMPKQRAGLGEHPACIVLTDKLADLSEYCHSGQWLLLLQQSFGQERATAPAEKASQSGPSLQLSFAQPKAGLQKLTQALHQGRLMVEPYMLAEHCDRSGTTQLIHNLRPQHIIFVHGSPTYLADLTNLEELQNRYQLHSPAVGKLVKLPIGETFLQPAAPEMRYRGEVAELDSAVAIALPVEITNDLHWQNFADTGLVEAFWQGDDLVLRGLSQYELRDRAPESAITTDSECCGTCQHYRSQRCWNQASALCGFRVTPDGYCPAYEALER